MLQAAEEAGQVKLKPVREGLQDAKAWILLPVLDLRKIAAIETKHFGHFDLGPTTLAAQRSNAIAQAYANVSGHLQIIACMLSSMCWQLPTGQRGVLHMAEQAGNSSGSIYIPNSLQRRSKEPKKQIQFNVPLSWWDELTDLAREFDQDVATFLREATEDWLQKARKVRQQVGPASER
jgi:hypothetical protein